MLYNVFHAIEQRKSFKIRFGKTNLSFFLPPQFDSILASNMAQSGDAPINHIASVAFRCSDGPHGRKDQGISLVKASPNPALPSFLGPWLLELLSFRVGQSAIRLVGCRASRNVLIPHVNELPEHSKEKLRVTDKKDEK